MKISINIIIVITTLWVGAIYGQGTYHWNVTSGTAAWNTTTNWTPTRTTPNSGDILIFDGGGTVTINTLVAETEARIEISNNTNITLTTSSTRVITLTRAGLEGLYIGAGSSLTLSSGSAVTITLTTTTTATIYGTVTMNTSGHKFYAATTNAVTFKNGSTLNVGSGTTGVTIGNSASSFLFETGSTVNWSSGGTGIFGGSGNSFVSFQSGSNYNHGTSTTPSLSGRTYGNFSMTSGTISPTGSSSFICDNLSVTGGTLNLNISGTPGHSIKGNIDVSSGATLTFTPGSAATINFNGSSAQTITNSGTLTMNNANSTFVFANTSGVTFNSSITTAGPITVNSDSKLATSATYTNNNATSCTINGTFQINQGGFAQGQSFIYGSAGTLIFNNSSGSYTVSSGHVYWPGTNPPYNVSVLGSGGITMNMQRTVAGTFQTAAAVTNANNLTLNGTAQLNAGGSFGATPTYGSSSTLVYNTGGTYGRSNEFPSSGVVNLTLQNSTTLNYPNGSTAARSISGSLNIGSGSALYMDYSSPGMNNAFTVAGNATIAGSLSLGDAVGGDLKVGGNWSNNGGTLNFNSREVEFNGSSSQSIGGSSSTAFAYLKLNNAAGATLGVSQTVNNTLTLSSGDIDLNGYNITLGTSATLSETAGNTVKGTSGYIGTTRSLNAPSSQNVAGLGATLTSTANLGSTVIRRYHSAPSGNGNTGILRYYQITPTINTGLNATLVFNYDESELNSKPESKLILFRSETGAADSYTWVVNTTLNTTNNTLTKTGIDGFSYWGAGDSTQPFPVELITFSSSVNGRNILLSWNTATEVNSSLFAVERSTDKQNWLRVGAVDASGYSNAPKDYSFTDRMLNTGKYSYRLKIIDNDGVFEYSPVIEAEVSVPTEFAISQNYPNPFNPSTKINYDIPEDSRVVLSLYGITGEKVADLVNGEVPAGYYTHQVDMAGYNLTSGVYIYKLVGQSIGGERKYNAVRKMLYLR